MEPPFGLKMSKPLKSPQNHAAPYGANIIGADLRHFYGRYRGHSAPVKVGVKHAYMFKTFQAAIR